MVERNWAGNLEYSAATVHHPTTVDEIRGIVVGSQQVRVVGTRHSFNDIADAEHLISLDALPDDVIVDPAGNTVELNPAMTYGHLAPLLHERGLALHNLASLPHISVGGAIATGTHGSGDRLGNLATAVGAVDILRSDGEVVHLERGDADFDGAVVGLGALGVVLRVRLDVEPEYQVAQHVYEGLAWAELALRFDEITNAGDSVSLFTTWGSHVGQVWVKQRLPAESNRNVSGARPATVDLHPIAEMSAENCTPQLGVPGLWSDRLPHFKMGFTPSSGDELQSELLLPREAALDAIEIVRGFAEEMAPHLLVSEIRTVAADSLWMSPQYERATVALHFTWRQHTVEVMQLVDRIEAALGRFEPRPHWGKLFAVDGATLTARYPRHRDFVDLVSRFDAPGAFRTSWLARNVLI
ncbi:MAG TPA: FAD-binding protein [Ilumatobacteraceae bacterium]|nr:FAD-binding protein [Ilumatobacteraceae bacterium]